MSPIDYLSAIERAHARGDATEHTYLPYLKSLACVDATNEPKRERCGAPDYIISRKNDNLTIGYIEAKRCRYRSRRNRKRAQVQRYRQHLPNFDQPTIEFRWFVQRDGKPFRTRVGGSRGMNLASGD